MNSKIKTGFLTTLLFLFVISATAQTDNYKPVTKKFDSIIAVKTFRIGLFAPLYLDSVFNAENNYRYGKTFPKFVLPGLEFIQGAQIALDSLKIPNTNINAKIYDTKSYTQTVADLIMGNYLDSLDLIIGSVKDQEYIYLANFAHHKNIPFISATHPNDGGVTGNPFMVILNSTLKAHCEAIYGHILQQHATDKIFLVRKPGNSENLVQDYFTSINEPDGKPLLKIEVLNVDEDFSIILNKLDSNRKSIFIGGSLNETFANNLATYAQSISRTYPITLIGMPNWDGFSSLVKNKKLKNFPVLYTTPFYNERWDWNSKKIVAAYLEKYKGIPTDMTFKGYETTLQFINIINKYPYNLISHLNDYPSIIFSDFKFRPVFLNKKSLVPDYFENKNLYFIQILNGSHSPFKH